MNPFKFVIILLAVLMGFVFLVLFTSGEMDPAVREANLARQAKEAVAPKGPVLTQAEKNQAVFDSIVDGTYVDPDEIKPPSEFSVDIYDNHNTWMEWIIIIPILIVGFIGYVLLQCFYWNGDTDAMVQADIARSLRNLRK